MLDQLKGIDASYIFDPARHDGGGRPAPRLDWLVEQLERLALI
jgi:hypothetical protein